MFKKLIEYIDGTGMSAQELIDKGMEFQNNGIDELIVVDYSADGAERDSFLEKLRALYSKIDISFSAGTKVSRFEDIKKAFYTGATHVVLRAGDIENTTLLKEGSDRFGEDSMYVLKDDCLTGKDCRIPVLTDVCAGDLDTVASVLKSDDTAGLAADYVPGDIMELKSALKAAGIDINSFSTDVKFTDLKKDALGLVPCIVQDYRTGEVLMMAYLDEEAFDKTVRTGIMTYHSRSRNVLWIKGATSGHYQYLRELRLDCDSDTLLAKVYQVGAACHTGNRSCFFNTLITHEYNEKDISKVLASLYDVVVDRKQHPKEGSYTNYLFDKGIDKILKKCGEEATEMVIAAKNPDHEELKYEIADLLYHMTVLMVECGVDWNEVAQELANR